MAWVRRILEPLPPSEIEPSEGTVSVPAPWRVPAVQVRFVMVDAPVRLRLPPLSVRPASVTPLLALTVPELMNTLSPDAGTPVGVQLVATNQSVEAEPVQVLLSAKVSAGSRSSPDKNEI